MKRRSKLTNYDSLSFIKDNVDDDSLRFSFIGSCILSGSFEYVKKSRYMFYDSVTDSFMVSVAKGIFSKTSCVFNHIVDERKGNVSDLISKVISDNFEDLNEEISKINVESIDDSGRKQFSDIYILSLMFGKRLGDNFVRAVKDLGQSCEQKIINGYNSPVHRLECDPLRRDEEKYMHCLKKEYFFISDALESVYLKYLS